MLKVGIVGAGHWGPNLIRNFHDHQDSRVVVVVDIDPERLAEVKARYPEAATSTEPEAACAGGIDAVVISTPTSTHHALAKTALVAGKHVLVEKPITTKTAEAKELCRLADDAGLILMAGHTFVHNPAVQRVKKYLDAGLLGQVFYLSMVRTNLGPIRLDVNSAWDLAAHDISIANFWLESEPLSATAMGGSWINEGIHDLTFATLRYPNGVLANLHASWLSPRKARDITVVGDKRMLTFDDMNLSEPLRIYDKGVTEDLITPSFVDTFASFRASVREGDITIPKVAMGEPLRAECDHFIECILHSKRPITDGSSGLSVVRTLDAIERSMRNGSREEPLEKD